MGLNLKELIVSAVLPAFKEIGKAQVEDLLQQLHDHNPAELYEESVKGLNSSFKLLKQVAVKTKTHIDDGIVDLVLEAVQNSAAQNGVML